MIQSVYFKTRRRQILSAQVRDFKKAQIASGMEDSGAASDIDATAAWLRHFSSQTFYARHVIPNWEHQMAVAPDAQHRRKATEDLRFLRHNQMQIRGLRHLQHLRLPQPLPQVRLRPPLAPFQAQQELMAIQRGLVTPPPVDNIQRVLLAKTLLEPANLPFPILHRQDFCATLLSQDFPNVRPGVRGPYNPSRPETFQYCPLTLSDARTWASVTALLDTRCVREPHHLQPVKRHPYNDPPLDHPCPHPDATKRRFVCLLCEADSIEIANANLGAVLHDTKVEPEPLTLAAMPMELMCFHLGDSHSTPVASTIFTTMIRKKIRGRRLSAPDLQDNTGPPPNRSVTALSQDQKATCYRWYPEWLDPAQADARRTPSATGYFNFANQPKLEIRNSPTSMVAGPVFPAQAVYAEFNYKSPISFAYIANCQKDPVFQHGYKQPLPFNRTRLYQVKFPELHALDVEANLREQLECSLPKPGDSRIAGFSRRLLGPHVSLPADLPVAPQVRRYGDVQALQSLDTPPCPQEDRAHRDFRPMGEATVHTLSLSPPPTVRRLSLQAQQQYENLGTFGIVDVYQAVHIKNIPLKVHQMKTKLAEAIPPDAATPATYSTHSSVPPSDAASSSAKDSFVTPESSPGAPAPTPIPSPDSSMEDISNDSSSFNQGFVEPDIEEDDHPLHPSQGQADAPGDPELSSQEAIEQAWFSRHAQARQQSPPMSDPEKEMSISNMPVVSQVQPPPPSSRPDSPVLSALLQAPSSGSRSSTAATEQPAREVTLTPARRQPLLTTIRQGIPGATASIIAAALPASPRQPQLQQAASAQAATAAQDTSAQLHTPPSQNTRHSLRKRQAGRWCHKTHEYLPDPS